MEASGLPWVDRFSLAARQELGGRRIASRWNSLKGIGEI